MRREVEAILAASSRAAEQNFLGLDAFTAGAKILAGNGGENVFTEKQIGNYKIVREIGRGGMGAVYLAEREDFRQMVALKVIKRGMDTDEIVKRFRRERQVLASLNHRFIARLLDGGTTEKDLPFFVMEYVEGLPITEFCDRKKLNIEQRLELFRKVCSAVAYAHQNLIVHRDLKPSNILVTENGEPKLLDFGISKLLASDTFFDTTVEQTAEYLRLMTPEYASPEQIRGERITTASDIYSLGVLLYELLSGHRPLKLKNRPTGEIIKIISEREPSAPSTAALTAEEVIKGDTKEILSPETIADARGDKPERLKRKLSGDLDNIVLMSLRKEPDFRYESVEQFSEDLRRHLEGLPVLARPGGFGYRAEKFIRRNRTTVIFASAALLAVLIAVVAVLFAFYSHERNEMNDPQVFRVGERQTKNPEAYRALLKGQYFFNTRKEYEKAEEYFRETISLDPNFVQPYVGLASIYAFAQPESERGRAAEPLLRKALELDPDSVEARSLLGFILAMHRREWNESEIEFKRALELNPNYAVAHQWYATNLAVRRKFSEAELELRKAMEIDPLSLSVNTDLCEVFYFSKRFDEAIVQCKKTLELDENFFMARFVLAKSYVQKQMYREAAEFYLEPNKKSANLNDWRGLIKKYIEAVGSKREDDYEAYGLANHYAILGDRENTLRWLEKADRAQHFMLPFANAEPAFEFLRGEPRFQNIMRRAQLPES